MAMQVKSSKIYHENERIYQTTRIFNLWLISQSQSEADISI